MKIWEKCRLGVDATIKEAIENLEASELQIALVLDKGDILKGVVTDGDIRRGLLKGASLQTPVREIMNNLPVTMTRLTRDADIIRLMRAKNIHQVPIVDEDGRLEDLELLMPLLARHVQHSTVDNWVVLMAGGLGTRLRPLTENTPKPLLPVGGKPLLTTIVTNFLNQGFDTFFFSINYKAEMVKTHFGDGRAIGAKITYLEEKERLGTAGSLRLLPEKATKPVIVMNGDLLTRIDFRKLIDFHTEQNAKATMCVRDYRFQVPYGVAVIEDNKLKGLSEKPVHQFFVNAGIYVLNPEILEMIPETGYFDMTELFEQLIQQDKEVAVFPVHEYWMDIGRFEDLEQARAEFSTMFEE